MKTLFVIALLLVCIPAYATLTTSIRQNHVKYTAATITTTTTDNYTDTFPLGPYESASFQCAWSAVTGTQPEYTVQTSNDESNWDSLVLTDPGSLVHMTLLSNNTTGTIVTSGASGSNTFIVSPLPVQAARVKVSTASTAGNLLCTVIAH